MTDTLVLTEPRPQRSQFCPAKRWQPPAALAARRYGQTPHADHDRYAPALPPP